MPDLSLLRPEGRKRRSVPASRVASPAGVSQSNGPFVKSEGKLGSCDQALNHGRLARTGRLSSNLTHAKNRQFRRVDANSGMYVHQEWFGNRTRDCLKVL